MSYNEDDAPAGCTQRGSVQRRRPLSHACRYGNHRDTTCAPVFNGLKNGSLGYVYNHGFCHFFKCQR